MSAISPPDSPTPLRKGRHYENFSERLRVTRKIVGYSDEDAELVRRSRDVVLASADAIVNGVYQQLVSNPETAQYFALPDGRPDRMHLAERSDSLRHWLAWTIEAPLDELSAAYLAGIGRAHTKRGGQTESRVQARYLVITMNFIETSLVSLLDAAIEDRAELLATFVAWSKLLTINLDLFLAVYGTSEGTSHWY